MGQPYIGEIRMFGGNFAPAGWMFCHGQTLPISENDALFVLIGTTYGGDGQETFNLPNLQGRGPIHMGQGVGLSAYSLGQNGGVETVTLNINQIPSHTHLLTAAEVAPRCSSTAGTDRSPVGRVPAVESAGATALYSNATPDANMAGLSGTAGVSNAGGSQPHGNMPPFLCISFIISLFGVFPPQN
jgi:microcystin-dependent protein